MPRINQPLLDGVEEHGPVGIVLAEIVRPSVDMGVEVHQCQGTATPVGGSPQQRQRYSVVAAQRDEVFEAAACSSMSERLFGISPSAMRKSPMSATDCAAGSIHQWGWSPSTSMRLACRIAAGPKRAPLRLVVPISNGIPAMQNEASVPRRSIARKLGGSAKVGTVAIHCGDEAKDRSRDRARPAPPGVAFGGCGQGRAADDEVARLIDALALVPGRVRVELNSQCGCQHGRGEILGIIAALLARHAIAVMLGDVAVHRRVRGARQSDTRVNATARLVGLRPRHDAKGDLARSQRTHAVLPFDLLAMGRQNG